MWYPVSDTITAEPIERSDAQAQVSADEVDFDTTLDMLIASARAHVEAYCNRAFAPHEMIWACDSFEDLARLPMAPAAAVTEITYIDPNGEEQTLPEVVYRLNADGLSPSISLRRGQVWPAISHGERIKVSASFGGDCPADVKHAMLLLIASGFTAKENDERPSWTAVDALLANHRRGAW